MHFIVSSADKVPLLGYVLIGIGSFVLVSLVAIVVSTTALCRRYYVRREMMNNFKVREEGWVWRGWDSRMEGV